MNLRSHVRRYLARRLSVPEIPVALERLCKIGFQPHTIFDVGAYRGEFTTLCRGIWASSQIAAFEPLAERARELEARTKSDRAVQVHQLLLGPRRADNVPLYARETASSVLEEHVVKGGPIRHCQMSTIDDVVASSSASAPELLKLDVQGFELEVLKGAERSLSGMRVILVEVNLLDLHVNAPSFAELIAWLDERGWVAYDICGLTRRPLDHALWQADMLFVPVGSPLRANKRWV